MYIYACMYVCMDIFITYLLWPIWHKPSSSAVGGRVPFMYADMYGGIYDGMYVDIYGDMYGSIYIDMYVYIL